MGEQPRHWHRKYNLLRGLFRNALRGKENKRSAIADKSGFMIASVTLSRYQLLL